MWLWLWRGKRGGKVRGGAGERWREQSARPIGMSARERSHSTQRVLGGFFGPYPAKIGLLNSPQVS
jgi:hypothetical protein